MWKHVSLPWPITLLHLANPVSSICDGSGQLTIHWCRKQHEHLYMLLLAVGLTAAIVYLLVWAVNCWTNCKSSRTLPLVLSQVPEDQSIWRMFYEIFTGYRFGRGHFENSCFGVQVPAWHGSALPTGICQPLSSVVSHQCWSAHSGRLSVPRITATAVSQYSDLGHGSVFLLTSEPQTFQSKHSDRNCRHFCLQCDCRFSALAALRAI